MSSAALSHSPLSLSSAACSRTTSQASSSKLMTSFSGLSCSLRMRSRMFSMRCMTSEKRVAPSSALLPFTECAARKIECNASASGAFGSSRNSCASMFARCSSVSSKNIGRKRVRSTAKDGPMQISGLGSQTTRLTRYLADNVDQLVRIERFHEPARGAGTASLVLHAVGAFRGEQKNRHRGVLRQRAQRLDQRDAVHLGHALIGDDQIE